MYRLFLLSSLLLMLNVPSFAAEPVDAAKQLTEQGLHKDAYDLLRPWLLDAKNGNHADFGKGLGIAVQALQQLNRVGELDELLESAATAQKGSWRAITSIAAEYRGLPNYGYIVDNQFERGYGGRRSGQWVRTGERDRLRALQLLNEVMPLALAEAAGGRRQAAAEGGGEVARFFLVLADGLMQREWWQMQVLTDLTALPDYTTDRYYGGGSSGAPVDTDGNPIFYYVPESWEAAKSDGERWRWALEQVANADPDRQKEVWRKQADFYRWQFGEQTLQEFDFFRRSPRIGIPSVWVFLSHFVREIRPVIFHVRMFREAPSHWFDDWRIE